MKKRELFLTSMAIVFGVCLAPFVLFSLMFVGIWWTSLWILGLFAGY